MFAQEGEVSTEADHLLRILKERKEISFEQAAKELDVPVETIEAWANFLEEEGVISISYKLTTPYLIFAPKKDKDSPLLRADIRKRPYPSGPKEPEEPVKEPEIKVKVLPSSGEIDLEQLYLPPIQAEMSKPVEQKKVEFVEEAPPEFREELHRELPKIEEDYTTLIEKINKLVSEDRFEEAKELYEKLRERYVKLPEEYRRRREQLEQGLTKIDSELSLTFNTYVLKQLKEYGVKILTLILEGREALKKDDLEKANNIYKRVMELFRKLPPEPLPEKRELEKEILDFSNEYTAKHQAKAMQEFNARAWVIQNLLTKIDKALLTNKIQEAIDLYGQIKQEFQGLPRGFLKEKSSLQAEILRGYASLAEKHAQMFLGRFNMMVVHIRDLLEKMKQQVLENKIIDAEESYAHIKELFTSLPEGFMAQKSELQNQIYTVYTMFVERYPKVVSEDFNKLSSQIRKLVEEARIYLKSNNYTLAGELYREMTLKFNKLPRVFPEKHLELREEIAAIYKELLLHPDSLSLSGFTADAEANYKELLALILKLHEHIGNKEFELIEGTLHVIEDVYAKLPLNIITKQTSIREEIAKLQLDLSLYNKTKQLQNPNIEPTKFVSLIREIMLLKEYLEPTAPQDKPLFDYANQVLTKYSPISRPITPLQVKEGIENYSQVQPMQREITLSQAILGEAQPNAIDVIKAESSIYYPETAAPIAEPRQSQAVAKKLQAPLTVST